jgi:hypothetical protein
MESGYWKFARVAWVIMSAIMDIMALFNPQNVHALLSFVMFQIGIFLLIHVLFLITSIKEMLEKNSSGQEDIPGKE